MRDSQLLIYENQADHIKIDARLGDEPVWLTKEKLDKSNGMVHIALVKEIRSLIGTSRSHVATAVNASLTMLYWNIGKRINDEVLQKERAEYGKEIVATLSSRLTTGYGRGGGPKKACVICAVLQWFFRILKLSQR